jgi:alanine dehydrogenase
LLLLNNDDVRQVLTMEAVVARLREFYREVGEGVAVNTPRNDLHHPLAGGAGDVPGAHYLKTMTGGFVAGESAALRISSDVVRFPLEDGRRRRLKQPIRPGRWLGLALVFSLRTGELRGILQDGWIQRLRVGATNGIADDLQARPDASRVGILGSGAQARAHLEATSLVRRLTSVRVWSPNAEHRGAFAREMGERLGLAVEVAPSPEEAAAGADILMTATNSRQGFVPASWLTPGMHVSTLQRDELTMEAYAAVDQLAVHTHLMEVNASSEALPKVDGRTIRDHPFWPDFDWARYPTLGDLVCGRVPGRRDDRAVTGFINSIGLGGQFAAVGDLALRLAAERGLGREIDTEWFLETMHP